MIDFNDIYVIIDNGHGKETKGKRSPDNRLMEWSYNREIAKRISDELNKLYIDNILLVDADKDVPLSKRANDANSICKKNKNKGKRTILISVHVNAYSTDQWSSPAGWSVWTTKGKTNSDILAECIYEAAKEEFDPLGRRVRSDMSDNDHDYEDNFYIIKHANCPAVLTENFFMTNKSDVDWMLTEEGKNAIVQCHIKGIIKFCTKMS